MATEPQYGLPGLLAIERKRDEHVIGYISLSRDLKRVGSRDAEIGFRLATPAWGEGYATEAASGMIDASKSITFADRIVAIVDPNNRRSVQVLKKVGMIYDSEIMFEGYDYPDHLYTRHLHSLRRVCRSA